MRKLSNVWKLLNLPCEEISKLVSLSLDSELPRAERLAMSMHLLYCKACRRFRQQVLSIKTAMNQLSTDTSRTGLEGVASLSPEARARIQRALRDADATLR
jgi:hypothetical protein